MNDLFHSVLLTSTGAASFRVKETIQSLWSGYGKIMRVDLEGSSVPSVVVKHVQLPLHKQHPKGWNTDIGHQRKLRSYQVETHWYESYSSQSRARLPQYYAIEHSGDEVLMVLEDLDAAGFALRKSYLDWLELSACLEWLAKFHASFMGHESDGLWEVGTYWHLETRPQELAVLEDKALKDAAAAIDHKLNTCTYKTFVHGDAKLANFCFSADGRVAGVDFQYVGGGCGMKDLAYFVGSCLNEQECERLEDKILDTYFDCLAKAMGAKNELLEEEWRSLYRVAWADFHRFIKGWSPGHWKINSYSERISQEVINQL
jgi:hypothetical protein